ncbi:hypothetical protein GCM10009123_11960 [Kangiella japonica]|uniref:DUF3667 domain-containing protein n=1 Tax=Kangiella japonica TaxID=647384 RepID=A0ABN0SY68_9GAMM
MSNNSLDKSEITPNTKYCQHCGQKNFRPHRSVRELVWEFVENWFGYDSKAYKTARALCRPAALTLDYFRNSHHHIHYVTPIRLYIFLSIIFFLLTSFGGLNVASIDITTQPANKIEQEINQAVDANPLLDEASKSDLKLDNDQDVDDNLNGEPNTIEQSAEVTGNGELFGGCDNPGDLLAAWPGWLDSYFDAKIAALCDSYDNISYLPRYKQTHAKAQFGLTLLQNAIESLPQAFLLTLPLLALALKLLYLRRNHLYVEHLVLLIHSHSFMFAAILTYLGWHQLEEAFEWLAYIPVSWALLIWAVVYLYLSMKRLYQQSHLWTVIKFVVFSAIYAIVFSFIMILALMKAMITV